ncbi:MAG TPA: PAS domain S-box protein [Capsulimonadaceae bacterium]
MSSYPDLAWTVLSHAGDAVVVVDTEKRIIFLNRVAAELYGTRQEDALGRHVSDVYRCRWTCDDAATTIASMSIGDKFVGAAVHECGAGKSLHVESAVTVFHNVDSSVAGEIILTRAVSDLLRANDELKKRNADLVKQVSDFQILFSLAPVGLFVASDAKCSTVRTNPAGATMLGMPLDANMARSAYSESPNPPFIFERDGHEIPLAELPLRKAAVCGEVVTGEQMDILRADGTRRHIITNVTPLRDNSSSIRGCIGVLSDITELHCMEAALRESEDLYRSLIALSLDAVSVMQCGIVVLCNDAMLKQVGATSDDQVVGRPVTDLVHPDCHATALERVQRVLNGERLPPNREQIQRIDGTAFDVEVALSRVSYRNAPAILCVARDITDRLRLDAALRESEERHRAVVASLAEGVTVQNINSEIIMANASALQILGVTEDQIMGQTSLDPEWRAIYPSGARFYANKHPSAVTLATGKPLHDVTMGIRKPDGTTTWMSINSQPIVDHVTKKRIGVVTSFFDVTERTRMEKDIQDRAEGEAVLNRIGFEIRSSADPATIEETVAKQIGAALRLDRCFYATYSIDDNSIAVGKDWRRIGLASLAGKHKAADLGWILDDVCPGVVPGSASSHILRSPEEHADMHDHRGALVVPFFDDGEVVAVLYGGMTRARIWADWEVALFEQAATLAHAAVEMASAAKRQNAIAHQLQTALQPSIPTHAPGLDLAFHYKAALDEAAVGGDFGDVFAGDNGETYLVVGDVSGKGLNAASQVATIRNIMRYELGDGSNLAKSLTRVNNTIYKRNLLSGFATVFVGRYDAATKAFSYVNCGQDSALVLRAGSGEIEALSSTGTVIGALEYDEYVERRIELNTGDMIAIFTDGLIEAGPSRRTMLREEGVARLMLKVFGKPNAAAALAHLVAAIDAYSRGTLRDDQCLLMAAVTDI